MIKIRDTLGNQQSRQLTSQWTEQKNLQRIVVNIPRQINSPSQNQIPLTGFLEAKAYWTSKLSKEVEDEVEVILPYSWKDRGLEGRAGEEIRVSIQQV